MATMRCQVRLDDGIWQITFEGLLNQSARSFRTEAEAYMALAEWCGVQRLKGHDVDVRLPTTSRTAETGFSRSTLRNSHLQT